jgi:hypothetical protein
VIVKKNSKVGLSSHQSQAITNLTFETFASPITNRNILHGILALIFVKNC